MTVIQPRIWLVLVAALLFAGGALLFFGQFGINIQSGEYRTLPVSRGDILTEILATGALAPVTSIEVGTQVSGRIEEVFVDFNDRVDRGQLLAKLDPQAYQARARGAAADLDVARAARAMREASLAKSHALLANIGVSKRVLASETKSAEAGYRDAEAAFQRKRGLAKNANVSARDLEKAESERDAARASLEAAHARLEAHASDALAAEADVEIAQAQLANAAAVIRQKVAALEQAQVDLDRTEIRAPADGVVISRKVEAGQTVAASLQAPTLFTLADDLTRMQVETRVDEADVGRVRVGQTAWFSVDAYPGRRFTGEVVSIRKAPRTRQNVVTYTVIVNAANLDLALFPGMTAVVRVAVDEARNVLLIPNAALRYRAEDSAEQDDPPPGRARVWSMRPDGEPVPVEIGVGASDNVATAMTAGALTEGQALVVGRSLRAAP